jgi:hypothetical protein
MIKRDREKLNFKKGYKNIGLRNVDEMYNEERDERKVFCMKL